SLFTNSEASSVRSLVPRTSFRLFVTAFSQQRGTAQRFLHLGAAKGWEAVSEWDVVNTSSKEARTLAKVVAEAVSIPSAKMDVVVGPEVAGIIAHESIGHPFEADRILGREAAQAGESYMTRDYVGKKIGSEEDYVSDDPTIPGSFGFYLYDDEGVKARKRTLVEAGVVKEFLHNRETAAELGVESNGSARSMGYAYEPIIRMANTYFEPGDYSFEELIEDVGFGVFINNFMEWNIDDRRVNQRYVGLEAYLIENGELTKLVRNPVIEVTTFDLHKSLDARGRDLKMFAAICGKGDPAQGAPVFVGGPSLRFRGLFVSCR
ncbi:TPA: TldD/PmbA family protein, partial [Candidatus Micrarchaeota archaeon]|nr:TldD/PmbA family protein [Candidatus Micrarchaeota archaeon]